MARRRLDTAQRIATWRKRRRLTLTELAQRTGIRLPALSLMENRKQAIRVDQLERIAGALGLSMFEFYNDELLQGAA